ncbi:hypothetical protein ACU4GD_44960 [Cupriavidus basilensis]
MKGSLHTDELLQEVTAAETAADRLPPPHVFAWTRHLSQAAVHHRRRGQHRSHPQRQGRYLPQRDRPSLRVLDIERPKVAILSAVETVTDEDPLHDIDAAALCMMEPARGQIEGRHPRRPAGLRQCHQPRKPPLPRAPSPRPGAGDP